VLRLQDQRLEHHHRIERRSPALGVRIPTMPVGYSDLIPATIPI
jgi:hypothetical protein